MSWTGHVSGGGASMAMPHGRGWDASAGGVAGSGVDDRADMLPPKQPEKVHWSTKVFLAGMSICVLGLLVTIAGVPASMGYDVDGAPNRNKPNSHDPMKLTQSLDGNMKWIDMSSSDAKGAYVGYIKSINESEAAIAPMVAAVMAMDSSVKAIDAQIGDVGATTVKMREDMVAMAEVSGASAATMEGLGGDIGFLSSSMLGLADATQQLTVKMASIEKQAGQIANNGTSQALANTKDLNATLPNEVPPAVVEPAGATGGGVGPVAGAQPAGPAAYEAEAIH